MNHERSNIKSITLQLQTFIPNYSTQTDKDHQVNTFK